MAHADLQTNHPVNTKYLILHRTVPFAFIANVPDECPGSADSAQHLALVNFSATKCAKKQKTADIIQRLMHTSFSRLNFCTVYLKFNNIRHIKMHHEIQN